MLCGYLYRVVGLTQKREITCNFTIARHLARMELDHFACVCKSLLLLTRPKSKHRVRPPEAGLFRIHPLGLCKKVARLQ